MRITIEPTVMTITKAGIELQVWTGRTQNGVRCFAFINEIVQAAEEDFERFSREMDSSLARRACGRG
jgi:hypothetical protein